MHMHRAAGVPPALIVCSKVSCGTAYNLSNHLLLSTHLCALKLSRLQLQPESLLALLALAARRLSLALVCSGWV